MQSITQLTGNQPLEQLEINYEMVEEYRQWQAEYEAWGNEAHIVDPDQEPETDGQDVDPDGLGLVSVAFAGC